MTAPAVGFSVVVPLYNSEPYLPDLLASFERQVAGDYTVEYVFVDDGSPDASGDVAQRWLDARQDRAGQVVRQRNGGVSRARNAGIEAASGDWIAFPDGDDFVGDRYLAATAAALRRHDDERVAVASANVKWFAEATGEIKDDHVLRFKFADGTRVIDLREHPAYVQSQAASAFFRRSVIIESGLRFIEDLSIAEDAVFVGNYLLAAPEAKLLAVADAEYFYRKRSTGDSSVDRVRTNPDFYFHRFERGYLPLFERAASLGQVPAWLDMMFIYDVRWFLPREANINQKATWMSAADMQRVLDDLAAVMRHVADSSVLRYNVTAFGLDHRCLLLALKGSPLPAQGTAKIVSSDDRGIELRYLYCGDVPAERFTRGGADIRPTTTKIRRLDVFGQLLLKERIVWLPAGGEVAVELDGHPVVVEDGVYRAHEVVPVRAALVPAPRGLGALPVRIAERIAAEIVALLPSTFASRPKLRGRGLRLRARRELDLYRRLGRARRFEHAWILMDKLRNAGDSAEYLYRSVREQAPDVNAWFVVNRDSPDWTRLRRDGFRLIAYGTLAHRAMLREADVLISTHLDAEMTNPMPKRLYRGDVVPWRYVYLQHGVMQHDLSHWFNRKPIDLLTTASVDEHQSIVEDGSSYLLTTKQARLTGFPRHDEVARLAAKADPAKRDIVLFAPTWRHSMLADKAAHGEMRSFLEPFEQTEFARNWLALINDPGLSEIARQAGARLVFLPHPNFRTQIDPKLMAPGVELMTSVDDVHELLTRCRSVVTDYSSIFFEAALAGADVSYFQFDFEAFLKGGHTYVPGYWSYDEHGLGPVGLTAPDLVDILRRQLTGDDYAAEREFYAARLKRTLPMVDGHSAERIIAEVKRLLGGDS
ncbi:MAG TPA: glycosyltransferase [Microbacterium sp.]|uniref:bifunctional glycosyltransferase/CDP-glycerol:glycerophosphate glycerophosphotransferase n=1 Tax=Microbacterium sp. TaxID=51671 RepID=UPI002B488885|nr:glycosyltransferase [Microbacterium sp.]HKT55929.1 glycosyltransferase [Microbacterium sp.]